MHEREQVIQKHLPIVIFGLFLPGLDTYIISVHPFHSEHLLNLEVKGVALIRYQVIICLNVKLELALLAPPLHISVSTYSMTTYHTK